MSPDPGTATLPVRAQGQALCALGGACRALLLQEGGWAVCCRQRQPQRASSAGTARGSWRFCQEHPLMPALPLLLSQISCPSHYPEETGSSRVPGEDSQPPG